MVGVSEQLARDAEAIQGRIQARIDRLQADGKVEPLKLIDADVQHLLDTLALDAEINEDFDCADGEMSLEARRLETTARRLVREAGYALPETTTGG